MRLNKKTGEEEYGEQEYALVNIVIYNEPIDTKVKLILAMMNLNEGHTEKELREILEDIL